MSSPALTPTRPRTNWIALGLEGGAALLALGLLLLYLNPFWRLDETGYLDRRVQWWNYTGQAVAGLGLLILSLALVGLLAALVFVAVFRGSACRLRNRYMDWRGRLHARLSGRL